MNSKQSEPATKASPLANTQKIGPPPLEFELFDPRGDSHDDLVRKTRAMFSGASDDLIARLVMAVEQIAESRERIKNEIRSMGANLYMLFKMVIDEDIQKLGDAKLVRDRAATVAYSYIKSVLQIERGKCRLYMTAFDRFRDSADVLEVFKISELAFLVNDSVDDDEIAKLLEAKKKDEKMTVDDTKNMLALLQQSKKALNVQAESNRQLEAALADATDQIKGQRAEQVRLREAIGALEEDQAKRKKTLEVLQQQIAKDGPYMASLAKQLADAETERLRLNAEYNEGMVAIKNTTKTEVVERIVVEPPADLVALQATFNDLMSKSQEVAAELAAKRLETAELDAQVERQRKEIAVGEKAQTLLNVLSDQFGKFSEAYSKAQTAVLASGDPQRYEPTIRAIGDSMRKFFDEINAVALVARI